MAQQTAVEWLIKQLKTGLDYNPLEKNGYSNAEEKIFEQAKQMEKEQIINAYSWDRFPCSDEDAEQYYNETYNK